MTTTISQTPARPSMAKWLSRFSGNLAVSSLRLQLNLGARLLPGRTLNRACDLFCTPLRHSRQRARAAKMQGAQRESLRVNKSELAVYRWCTSARQPYVLLVHGWSSCAAAFLPWVRPLQQAGYAVVAFDQPGHGLSQGTRANLPDFVDALMAMTERYGSPAALVGHSLGGAAVAVALARGLDTKSAILVSPAADLAAATQRFTRILRLPDDFSDQMVAAFEAGPVPIEALKAHRIAPHIKANVLVVHDAEDREIPCEEGQRYERFCPNASLIQTSGLGHSRILGDAGVIGAGIGFLAGKLQTEKNAASSG